MFSKSRSFLIRILIIILISFVNFTLLLLPFNYVSSPIPKLHLAFRLLLRSREPMGEIVPSPKPGADCQNINISADFFVSPSPNFVPPS